MVQESSAEDERVARLVADNAALRAELASAREVIVEQDARIAELSARLGQTRL